MFIYIFYNFIMVKTFEEEQKNVLDKKSFDTLLAIFSKYVLDGYKQFRWTIGGSRLQTIINQPEEINIILSNYKKLVECNFIYFVYVGDKRSKEFSLKQNFPIYGNMTPKELGKLAQNIFKWVKEQMKKIPD